MCSSVLCVLLFDVIIEQRSEVFFSVGGVIHGKELFDCGGYAE